MTERTETQNVEQAKEGGSLQSAVDALVSDLRLMEIDHSPDGWPAVKMKQLSMVLDVLDQAMGYLAEVEYSIDDWNFPLGLNDRVTKLCDNYFGHGVRPE